VPSASPRPRSSIRSRLATAAWWLAFALALGVLVASMPGYAARVARPPSDFPGLAPAYRLAIDLLSAAASFGAALLSVGLAALLFARRRGDVMAVFVAFYLLAYGILFGGPLEMLNGGQPGAWADFAIRLQTALLTTPTLLLLGLFPSGRFAPRWMRLVVLASLPFSPLAFLLSPKVWVTFADPGLILLACALGGLMLAGAYAQVHRYRRVSTPAEQQQTKWFVFGLLVWLGLLALLTIPYTLLLNWPAGAPLPWWAPLNSLGWWLSLGILPVSLALAILRYRLWDIDVLIRRTLVYSAVTTLVVALYYGGVVGLGALARALTGQARSPVVTVATTLALAAAFNPLRRWVQGLIDRRFYRRRYDAAQTVADFAAGLRTGADAELEPLVARLLAAVDETLQPEHASLWLRPQPQIFNREDAKTAKKTRPQASSLLTPSA